MLIYICLIVFIMIFGILLFINAKEEKTIEKRKKSFLIIIFFILFLIMGFREVGVGTDTTQYVSVFLNYSKTSLSSILSTRNSFIGYALLNKLICIFSTEPHTILIVSSAIILYLIAKFIYKNSDHVVYSTVLFILFYHYFAAFNISRQYISIAIIANAYTLLKEKKIFKYLVACLIAISIHNTAVVGLTLIPLAYMNFTKKNITLYSTIILGVIFIVPYFMELFVRLFPHYEIYFQERYLSNSGLGSIVMILIYLFINVMAILFKSRKKEAEDRDYYMMLIINTLTLMTSIVASNIFIINRMTLYYAIFSIAFIPKVFDRISKNIILYFIFFMLMLFPFAYRLASNDSEVLPYKNYIINQGD